MRGIGHVFSACIIAGVLNMLTSDTGAAKPGKDYPVRPVPFAGVRITGGFWLPRMETNRKVTIPYAFKKCEETGRISNFAKAAGLMEGKSLGFFFNDSDLYKVIEGAAYCLKLHPDPKLEKYVDGVIDKIAAAQWKDGYLYTFYSNPKHQPEKRWTNIRKMHELYCAGHFFEAAVAYYRSTGKRKILDVAIRLADKIDSVFGPSGRKDPPGHQEIEIALARLYRITGKEKYLKLAKFFLDQRGRPAGHKLYGVYAQDHKPVIEQDEPVGHAVRAGYMYCGMADVAALTGDPAYIKAIDRIWINVARKRLYITGGVGASNRGEAFGPDYHLPNMSAYCETCAAVANAMWNHRLFLLHGDAKYIDVVERVIYNGFLSGVSMTGDRFFYPNPLASSGKRERRPWFGCACCPTNAVRFLPSIPGYAYAVRQNDIYVNLFLHGTAVIGLKDQAVKLALKTNYPWDGAVEIAVDPEKTARFGVNVRVPGWARNQGAPGDLYRYMNKRDTKIALKVNGENVDLKLDKGFARIDRTWKARDVINLDIPMPIRRVLCNEKVEANTARIAIQRGPLVYCAEGKDNGGHALDIVLGDDVKLKAEHRKDMLGGITVITGAPADGKPFLAIPYYAWAHRGKGEMAVWLSRNAKPAEPEKQK